jgi:uncharacterized protein (TIGR03000 family)
MSRHRWTLTGLAALGVTVTDARAQSANPPPVTAPPLVISNGNQIVPYRPAYVEGYGSPPTPPPFGYPPTPGVEVITVQPNGVVPAAPAPAPVNEPAVEDGKARLTVWVPTDADVWLQGKKMDVSGRERKFTTPVLGQGQSYNYEVRVAWTENGKPVEFVRKLSVMSGDDKSLAFNAAPKAKITRPAK